MKTAPAVCVVDDDPCFLRALSRLMLAEGLSVRTFSSGAEFLRSLAEVQPRCVVMDVQMPGVGGLEVQLQLSASDPTLPVIFITAFEDERARELALNRGAIAFFYKPVRCETLCAAIRTALERRCKSFQPDAE